ncbi:MAG TPA: DoxX family protein [Pyrinomonadaceae bacterium]|nr:DoxX family protein [Pyrinomonadaceae bacterium]
MNILLWILQFLLGALFIFAGVMKFVVPIQEMTKGMKVPIPGSFLLFIGAVEILGGLGLVLPSLLKIKPGLTPLAAIGLAIIMIGAVVVTVAGGDVAPALIPLVIGLLCIFIAYGRWRMKPVG